MTASQISHFIGVADSGISQSVGTVHFKIQMRTFDFRPQPYTLYSWLNSFNKMWLRRVWASSPAGYSYYFLHWSQHSLLDETTAHHTRVWSSGNDKCRWLKRKTMLLYFLFPYKMVLVRKDSCDHSWKIHQFSPLKLKLQVNMVSLARNGLNGWRLRSQKEKNSSQQIVNKFVEKTNEPYGKVSACLWGTTV